MPISFSMIVLGTQLVMTVAAGVPKFDIARGCRLDSTQAFDLSTGQNETVKRCVADEQRADSTANAMVSISWFGQGCNALGKPTLAARRVISTS